MTITIVFRPTREGEIAPVLRSLLKGALRDYGLRAIKIEVEKCEGAARGTTQAMKRRELVRMAFTDGWT